MADFDFSELNALSADLGEVPSKAIPLVRRAVEVTARHLKDDWRDEARRSNPGHARKYAGQITYTMKLDSDGEIGAEVGPRLVGQGSFGFLEDAPGGVAAKPQRNVDRALRKNLADFEKGILMAGDEAFDA